VTTLRHRGPRAGLVLVLAGALAAACSNVGEDRVLAIQATGIVRVAVYFDRNGTRVLDAADTGLTGVGVRLILRGARDTVARGASLPDGSLRFAGIPVGRYVVDVDTTTFGTDSFRLTRVDTSLVEVTPGDSLSVKIAISYPQVTVRQARALTPGKKVFVVGVAQNGSATFGDSTVHLADTSSAIRLVAVASPTQVRDSVRVLGTRGVDGFGLPTMTNTVVAILGTNVTVTPRSLSTRLARNADTGRADAALVKVLNALIQDTATVPGGRRLKVNDGSDTVQVRLDSIPGFTPAFLAANLAIDTVGARICATGLLIPVSAGVWLLKPRSTADVVVKGTPVACP